MSDISAQDETYFEVLKVDSVGPKLILRSDEFYDFIAAGDTLYYGVTSERENSYTINAIMAGQIKQLHKVDIIGYTIPQI
jgi:hypothetical protein